jgi:hypothetical protein
LSTDQQPKNVLPTSVVHGISYLFEKTSTKNCLTKNYATKDSQKIPNITETESRNFKFLGTFRITEPLNWHDIFAKKMKLVEEKVKEN